jgi:hypothetical protein
MSCDDKELHRFHDTARYTALDLRARLENYEFLQLRMDLYERGQAVEIAVTTGWTYGYDREGFCRWMRQPSGAVRKERMTAREFVDVWFSEPVNGGQAAWQDKLPGEHAKAMQDRVLAGTRIRDPKPRFRIELLLVSVPIVLIAAFYLWSLIHP